MFFLRNRVTQPVDELTQTSLEPVEDYTSLLPRLFHNSDLFSGPEHTYENEAWAPELPQIRLFNRKRGIVEEQISSVSGPQ